MRNSQLALFNSQSMSWIELANWNSQLAHFNSQLATRTRNSNLHSQLELALATRTRNSQLAEYLDPIREVPITASSSNWQEFKRVFHRVPYYIWKSRTILSFLHSIYWTGKPEQATSLWNQANAWKLGFLNLFMVESLLLAQRW